MRLEPCDIFLTRGRGLISRGIRVLTRTIGEPRTKVNHVGLVVSSDGVVIEALTRVKRHKLVDQYGGSKTEVAVYRPINLTAKEKKKIVSTAESYVGRKYGYFKLVLHFLDWFLLGAYVFRRLAGDKYPICSWLVAESYKAVGKDFGVSVGAASPDDIWDFVVSEKKKYKCVRELKVL